MYMKKQERKEKKKNFQLCRLPWQSAKLGTTACKTRFADRLPGSRQSLCRLPGRRSAKETGRDGDGVFTDWLYGRRGSLYRLLSGRQSEKNSFPTSSLPAPLCRLPRRKTVGKAFADRFSAFADCFRQSAKRPIPVVVETRLFEPCRSLMLEPINGSLYLTMSLMRVTILTFHLTPPYV